MIKKTRLERGFNFLLGISNKYKHPKNWNDWKVTVIVPAYNEEKCIAQTIESIKEQTIYANDVGPTVDILVADDCSTDKTRYIAKVCGAKVVTTLRNTGTKAMAQNYALNQIKDKSNHIIVTIDADTILDINSIEKLVIPLQNESVVSTCGFVIPQKIETIWERSRFIEYLWSISVTKQGQSLLGTPLVSSGCFSAYRLPILRKYGGFSNRTMAEDMDLTWTQLIDIEKQDRKKTRNRVVLVPEACCYPLDPSSYKIYKAQVLRWSIGFLQVLGVHKFSIFKRLSLAVFALWNLLEAVVYLPILICLFFNMITSFSGLESIYNPVTIKLLVTQMLLSYSIIIVSVAIEGVRRKMLLKVLASLPSYFLVAPVNFYLFWLAIWKQWIKKEKLTIWVKGH